MIAPATITTRSQAIEGTNQPDTHVNGRNRHIHAAANSAGEEVGG